MASSEKKNSLETGIILLAAGLSSRLGSPKQLLPYEGGTLLQHALKMAISSNAQTVVVVLGAHAESIANEMEAGKAHVVVNENWQEGMASSIRCGVKALMEIKPMVQGLILMVCDQPFLTASLLNNLIRAHQETGKPVVTCSYGETFGPPTFFHKDVFGELLQLKGDVGARSIIREHVHEVEVVPFPEGKIDVDTEADYLKLPKR